MNPAAEIEKLLEHREWLRRLARSLVADAALADDLAQDTWTAALRNPPAHATSPRGWLATVARNLARNRHREGERRAQREAAVVQRGSAVSPVELIARAEMQSRVALAVVGLDEPYRTTVLLRYFEDMPPREIARATGVTVDAVKSRLRRAHERLRERLAKDEGGDRRAVLLALFPLARGTGARTAYGLTVGGLTMAAKTWALAAAAVLLVGAVIVSLAMREPARDDGPTTDAAATPDSTPAHERRAAVAADDLPPPVDLAACDRDLDLHGVVVAEDGTPVAGAHVETSELRWQRTSLLNMDTGFVATPGPETRTARDGTFSLRLRRGRQVALGVSAPGFAPTELPACQSGERVRVVLGPGVRLILHCRDEAGAPVAGASVELSPFDPIHRNPYRRITTESDAAGDCSVAGLRPGATFYVMAAHPRFASASDGRMIGVPPSGSAEETLRFRAGRTLRGRVTDAATGAPVPRARLSTSWTFQRSVRTGDDGRFEFAGVAENDFGLSVRADGYAQTDVSLTTSDTYDVALRRGDRVQGRLCGPDGKPAAGVLVSVTSHGAGGSDRAMHTQSGTDGTFAVADLRHDQPHALTFLAEGFGRCLLDFDPAAQEGGTVDIGDIALPAARLLEGRVVSADGSPVPGAAVRLYGFNEDRERLRPGKSFVSTMYGCREERRTDDLGRFRFPDLCPGDYDLEVLSADVRTAQKSVALPADRDVTDVEIRLPGGKPFVIEVRDSAGSPTAGVTVHVVTKDGWSGQITTQADGRAVFALESDAVSVDAFTWTKSLLPAPSRRVEPGATSATLVVRSARAVRGKIVDPEGKTFFPPGFLQVFESARPMSLDPWGQNVLGVFNDGSFEVSVPLDGSVDVVLAPGVGPGNRLLQGELRGLRPDATDVVLQTRVVALDRELTVIVLDPDGRPEAGAEVVAAIAPGRLVGPVVAGPNGRAYLHGLPASPLALSATLSADHPHRTDWVAASVASATADGGEIELTFTEGRRVAGILRGPDGRPAAGASVSIYRSQQPFATRESGADGRFALAVPLADSKSLYLLAWKRPEDGVLWEARLDGIPVPATDLDLTLKPSGR